VQDAALGQSLYRRLPFDRLSDDAKVALAKFFSRRAFDKTKELCLMCADKERGKMELLRFCAGIKNTQDGLPLAEELVKSPVYSQEATRIKAELLHVSHQYEKAIAVYQQCDNPPDNLWRIADCYAALGKLEPALNQLREVENFFRQHSAEAAWRMAGMYKRFGQRDQQIAALRNVLKKYPKSSQSSSAHQELEALGVRIGGGVDGNE
jgi:tetratricopeptide (TPR) repeat protein